MSFVDINGKQDLEAILDYLARKHLTQKKEEVSLQANFPLDILFTKEERLMANEVQSKSVKTGNLVEELVRILAENNPNLRVPKGFLSGPGVLQHEANHLWGKLTGTQRKKAAIFSRIPEEEVRLRAYAIASEMREQYDKGSSLFRTSYLQKLINQARAELNAIPPTLWQKKPGVYLVDFALRNKNDDIFFGELKASSGGDGSGAIGEMRNLLKAVLALSNYPESVMPVAAIAFPAGPVHNFATVFPEQSIWSGENLWQKLLTPPLEFSDLQKSMETALPSYRHATDATPVIRRRMR